MTPQTLSWISLERIARSLDAVAHLWLDPAHPLRQEAIEALRVSAGLSPSQIENALQMAFEEAVESRILDYVAMEPALQKDPPRAGRKVLHILPGNVFTAWIPGALTTLLAGFDCWLKPSALEPAFAPLWKRSVAEVDPGLAGRIRVLPWNPALLYEADAIVAYGSDETLSGLRRQIPVGKRFVGYGHKISVALVFRESLRDQPQVLRALSRDVWPINMQGCLSPQRVYVEQGDLASLAPYLEAGRPLPAIRRFEDWKEIRDELSMLQPHLSAMGYAGPETRIHELLPELESFKFSRICRLGEMQRPPLTWRNGGISLAEQLTA